MIIPRDQRNKNNPLYYRLRAIKDNMMSRCYNKNSQKYKSYGARGVHVDPRWHKINGFLEDIDAVDGWDEELFLARKLQLDKDIKYPGNKLYSKETCKWVSPEENIKHKPNAQRKMHAISPTGEQYTFLNQTEFAKEHELDRITMYDCLTKKVNQHKGWQFYYDGEKKPKKRTVYIATKGEDVTHSFSIAELADVLGIPRHKVYNAYRPERSNEWDGYIFTKK